MKFKQFKPGFLVVPTKKNFCRPPLHLLNQLVNLQSIIS